MTGGDGIVWPGSTFGDNSKQQAPAEGDQQKRKKENITGEPCSRQSRGSPDQIRSLAVGGRPEKEKEGGGGWLSLGRAKPKRQILVSFFPAEIQEKNVAKTFGIGGDH